MKQNKSLFTWLQNSAKNWCNEPSSRAERTERQKALARLMGVRSVPSVKNFYNRGQIKGEKVLDILAKIKGFKSEDEFITFLDTFQFGKEQLSNLADNKKRLLSLISRLSDDEISALITVLEIGLEANAEIED